MPTTWETQLRLIEENKLYASRYYAPVRHGAVSLCRKGRIKYEQILNVVSSQAAAIPAPRGGDPVKDNVTAFEIFADRFYARIAKFGRSYLHENSEGCDFEGVRLLGLPHFSATDSDGVERYVHLHASNWRINDVKAYLELLAIIVQDGFGSCSESLWCMDLRTGNDIKWRSSVRVRKSCENAARLYARMVKT